VFVGLYFVLHARPPAASMTADATDGTVYVTEISTTSDGRRSRRLLAHYALLSANANDMDHCMVLVAQTSSGSSSTVLNIEGTPRLTAPSQPAPISRARRRWLEDAASVERLMVCFYSNRLDEAEQICARGMAVPPLAAANNATEGGGGGGSDRFRDTRGAYALARALCIVARGVLSMERDSLSESLPRLYEAEKLLSESEPWVAQQLMRGLCEATIGGVLCAQHSFISGGWHLLKAYSAMRHLSIASLLEYDGMERAVVRSLAQIFLGSKALILELVPPAATRWFPGFVGSGSRLAGLGLLRQCVDEGGIFKLTAMDMLVTYHLGLKESMLIEWAASDWEELDALLAEADRCCGRTSMVFATKAAAVHARRRDVHAALGRLEEVLADPLLAGLPVVRAAITMEQSNMLLAACDWGAAAKRAQSALQLFLEHGKKSGAPAIASVVVRILLAEGRADEAEAVVRSMLELRLAKRKKKKWRRPDENAFEMFDSLERLPVAGDARRWDALQRLVAHMHMSQALSYLSDADACALIERFRATPPALGALVMSTSHLCCAMITTQQAASSSAPPSEGRHKLNGATLEHTAAGLAVEGAAGGNAKGGAATVQMLLWYHSGVAHMQLGRLLAARSAMERAAAAPKVAIGGSGWKGVANFVQSLEVPKLLRSLKERISRECATLTLGVDASHEVELELSAGATVLYEWSCERGAPVAFTAAFTEATPSPGATVVQQAHLPAETARLEAADGPYHAAFSAPATCAGGTLRLSWSSQHSAATYWFTKAASGSVVVFHHRVAEWPP
jgi:hypothetical protein